MQYYTGYYHILAYFVFYDYYYVISYHILILYYILLHWLLSYYIVSYYIALRRSIKKNNIVRNIIVQDHIMKYYTVIYMVYSWRRRFSKKKYCSPIDNLLSDLLSAFYQSIWTFLIHLLLSNVMYFIKIQIISIVNLLESEYLSCFFSSFSFHVFFFIFFSLY